MKHIIVLFGVLVSMGAGCSVVTAPYPTPVSGPVACTEEAKQCPDGSYVGRTGARCEFAPCPPFAPAPVPISGIEGKRCTGSGDAVCGTGYACTQECGPPVLRETDPAPGWSCYQAGKPRMCPICLAASTMIATPKGEVNVTELHEGTEVWTMNKHGRKLPVPILKIGKTFVGSSHRVVRLLLVDGREVWVSPGHSTADGRTIGELKIGDVVDGSRVKYTELVPYTEGATYDLLPSGDTGVYWANGILIGSTLY